MKIIGAGMAGLLAANILRKYKPVVLETKSELPENHKALLRHRTDAISKQTSIPFKKVNVIKRIVDGGKSTKVPTIAQINSYSRKVTGEVQSRSISSVEDEERFISPTSFVSDLAVGCDVQFNKTFYGRLASDGDEPIISTIPIMMLANILDISEKLSEFDFKFSPIKTIRLKVQNSNVYQTIYYPNKADLPYRVSITGDMAIYETMNDNMSNAELVNDFCLILRKDFNLLPNLDAKVPNDLYGSNGYVEHEITTMKFGKINKLENQDKLKELIGYITKEYNIYSLGRFATWRNILLDDVLNDVLIIKKLIDNRGYFTGK